MNEPTDIKVNAEMLKTVFEITGLHIHVKAGDLARSVFAQGASVVLCVETWKREHTARTTRITAHGIKVITITYGPTGWLLAGERTQWLDRDTYILAGENNRYLAGVN